MNKYKSQETQALSKSGGMCNHLGSTAFVTDNNATVTQGFLYAPFGEITTEYAPMWQNSVLPKYSFNAKELDEETGMYYYEARYYAPPVFTSRDLMFEKYFWMSPYAYCANNPMKYVDPTGCEKLIFFDIEYPKQNSFKGENAYNNYKKAVNQYYDNISLKKSAQKYKDNDDVIHLFAHGNSQGINFSDYGRKDNVDGINTFLLNHSETYLNNIGENKTSLLIMHSCETGKGENSIAQQLSQKAKESLLVIAPSEKVSLGNKETVTNNGSWNVFYKGKLVGKYNIPQNSDQ